MFKELSTTTVVAAINRSLRYIGCMIHCGSIYLLIAIRDIDLVNHVTPILLLLLLVDAVIIEATAGARTFHV